jgi:hypothetical protein
MTFNVRRWATVAFMTGCFIRALPLTALVVAVVYFFGDWCLRVLNILPKLNDQCSASDIYDTKGLEYIVVLIYFVCFFAVMYYTNPNRKPKTPPGVDKP